MRICLAQTKPVRGDVEANIAAHRKLIDAAITLNADLVLFPELSITGYEPTLAKELATTPDDNRFGVFQKASDENNIVIGIGAPLKKDDAVTISLLLFRPHKNPIVYSKEYLHSDEEPFFVPGQVNAALLDEKEKLTLAICYELSVHEHAERAFKSGAKIYLASVAKTAGGMTKAAERLSDIAKQYSVTPLMVNCLGVNDSVLCSGQSAIWNSKGELLNQLDYMREGLLLFDTATEETIAQYHQ